MDLMSSPHPNSLRSYRIAAILPVYNEERGVQEVLRVLQEVPTIHEVIVVDDGSQDRSMQIILQSQQSDPRMRLVVHPRNQGKGRAVYSGLCYTQAQLIVMLDADLRGLCACHVEDLILPMVAEQLDMTIGIFRRGKFYSDFSHWATPWLSGQRCIWRKNLERICWRAAEGYGLETALTVASLRYKWKCKKVIWAGVSHLPSEMHRGFFAGLLNRAKMYSQIGRAFLLASLYTESRSH